MNQNIKTSVGLAVIIILAATAGVFVWMTQKNNRIENQAPISTNSQKIKSQTSETENLSKGIIYTNNEYGFQLTLPQSWASYKVEKQVLTKEESLSGEAGEILLAFNYPFDNPIPRVEGDKSMGTLNEDWLWQMRIIPVANWKLDLCGNKPLCIQGKVLAKNDQYIFEDLGHINVGTGQLCIEQSQKLPMFCKAMNDFDESKINFKLLSPDEQTTNWQTYRNEEYGFEVKSPVKHEPMAGLGEAQTQTFAGNTFQTIQLVNGNPFPIDIIKNWGDPSKDPFGDSPYEILPQATYNGINWYIFYDAEGGLLSCDSAAAQTTTKDKKNTINISVLDQQEGNCPGNPKQSPSVAFLKQILSTFKFIN